MRWDMFGSSIWPVCYMFVGRLFVSAEYVDYSGRGRLNVYTEFLVLNFQEII